MIFYFNRNFSFLLWYSDIVKIVDTCQNMLGVLSAVQCSVDCGLGLRDWLSLVTDVTTVQGDWQDFFPHLFSSSYLLPLFHCLIFYVAVPMRGCLGEHSCMSSPFPIAILNGTCSLRALILFCGDVPAIKTKQTNIAVSSYSRIVCVVVVSKPERSKCDHRVNIC